MRTALRFLHTADIHLHAPLQYLKQNFLQRQQDFRRTLLRMKMKIREEQIPFWFIAGDLWEHDLVTPSTIHFLQDLFSDLPDTKIFISPGNHDPITRDSYYRRASWPDNVKIFTETWEACPLPEWDLCVYGIGFGDFHVRENPLKTFPGKEQGFSRHILVLHGSVEEEIVHSDSSPYAPFALRELEALGMDYAALGHIHKLKCFLRDDQTVFAAYPGSPEAIRITEEGERYCLLGEWRGNRFHLTPVPIQSRTYRFLEIDVTGAQHEQALLERIEQALREIPASDLVRVRLTGEISRYLQIAPELLEPLARGRFFVQWVDETVPDYDLEQLKREGTMISLFLQKIEDKIAGAASEQEKEEWQEARFVILDALLRKDVKI